MIVDPLPLVKQTLEETIQGLFPGPVSVCVADREMFNTPLWHDENKYIERAVLKRQREFAAGRNAARRALARFGVPPTPIPTNPDRTPFWPPGFVGSISHCAGFCGAVVAKRAYIASLGFDAEVSSFLSKDIAPWIYGSEEAHEFSQLPSLNGIDWGTVAFSAKEAFYKCYYPATGIRLDFLDVVVSLTIVDGPQSGTFRIAMKSEANPRPAGALTGRWCVLKDRIFSGALIPS